MAAAMVARPDGGDAVLGAAQGKGWVPGVLPNGRCQYRSRAGRVWLGHDACPAGSCRFAIVDRPRVWAILGTSESVRRWLARAVP